MPKFVQIIAIFATISSFSEVRCDAQTIIVTMDIDTLNGLKACPLFKGLAENEIIGLMHQVQYRVHEYERGEVLALEGDPCRNANIVLSGEMSAKIYGSSGRVISMNLHPCAR